MTLTKKDVVNVILGCTPPMGVMCSMDILDGPLRINLYLYSSYGQIDHTIFITPDMTKEKLSELIFTKNNLLWEEAEQDESEEL